MFCIVTVVAAFLLAIVFEGWPFAARRMRNRYVATAGLLISAYVLALVLYYVLFDFSFLPQAAQTPRRCGSARDEPRGAGHGTAEVTRRSSPLTQLNGCYKVATDQLLR